MEPNKDNLADQLSKYIKIEDGPKLGSGKLSEADDRLHSGLAHPFSLIIWLWKRGESPSVDVHGKEALNMAITWLLCVNIPVMILMRLLPILWWPISIVLWFASLAMLGLVIYALVLARQGKLLRYPFNLRLIK